MSDLLLFLDAEGKRMWEATWIGEWPPPPRLTLMRGRKTGYVTVFDMATVDPDALRVARTLDPEEIHFKLRSASKLPAPLEHVVRVAEYVPETDDA